MEQRLVGFKTTPAGRDDRRVDRPGTTPISLYVLVPMLLAIALPQAERRMRRD